MKKYLLLFTSLLWALGVLAQPSPPAELGGKDLRLWLIDNWYTPYHIELGYNGSEGARGRMYNFIDNNPDQNKVVCVYAGYEVSWTYGGGGTNPAPINCEHTVPQSFFNYEEPMKSDIHHLFPTFGEWNSTRSNFPFAEIDDTQTEKWMYLDQAQSAIPSANISAFSEFSSTGGNRFEPREDHKGNLARAIFYFYTMYEDVASVRPITDVADIAVLYQWHLQDPVDGKELERNNRIATYQGNRNPYIDYPGALAKAWGFAPACDSGPSVQVSELVLTDATHTSFDMKWTSGNRDARLIVVREGAAPTFSPNGSYTGISPDFAQATDQGGGNKICFAGGGNTLRISGLSPQTTYYVHAYEYCSATHQYLATDAPLAFITTAEAPVIPVGEGWKVTTTASQYWINFDQQVEGINNGPFTAAGFDQLPAAGQLDSDSWAISGFSDGELTFGSSWPAGDFARGTTAGNVTSGGIYAFEVSSGNYTLGVQPVGTDFTPGSITLRFQNNTGAPITELKLSYEAWVLNDQDRANSFNFSHSADGSNYKAESALDLTSGQAPDATPSWQRNSRTLSLSGLNIAEDTYYYLRWTGDDVSGSGSRDEFALDNIRLAFNGTPLCTEASTIASALNFSNISSNSLSLNWTRGNGANSLVIAKEGMPVDALPLNGRSYSASSAFGDGDEIGEGNFVVYNGSGAEASISNLSSGTIYHIAIVEWGCSPELYTTSAIARTSQQSKNLADLRYFRNSRNQDGLLLEWATSQESNLARIALERSTNAANFVQLASFDAAGTSQQERQYQHLDNTFSGTALFYRLRYTSNSGENKYSELLHLTAEALGLQDDYKRKLATLYPTPSNGKVQLQALEQANGKISLQLHNLQGAAILAAEGSLAEVNQRLNVQLTKLPAGSYLLLLQDKDGSQALRLIKQ